MRVIRLPRHGASLPGRASRVSCSADRQALGKITAEGVFLEQLENDPARYPARGRPTSDLDDDVVQIDLDRPMAEIRAELVKYPVKTRLSLTGPLVVARDIAHAKIKERLDAASRCRSTCKTTAVYYAGPAKTPTGYASGSFGPTTAGRMDSYVDQFQAAGGSLVMLAKGNRSKARHRRLQATAASTSARSAARPRAWRRTASARSRCSSIPELGMEAVWKIEVEDFPAFIVVDDKGNDFFKELNLG